jgi:hypothetical protein
MPGFALHVDSVRKLFDSFKIKKESLAFSLAVLGSVLVDLEELGIVKNIHGRSEKFLEYLLKEHPKYAPLAIGMMLHEELDNTIDTEYVNPNIPRAQIMVNKHLYTTEPLAAHLLIDHSVNVHFINNDPSVITLSEKSKKDIKHEHTHNIAFHITTFFGGEKDKIIEALHQYKGFDLNKYLNRNSAAKIYGQFLFLQKEYQPEKTGLMIQIKRIFNYIKFIMPHKQKEINELCKTALEKFPHPEEIYKKAIKAMEKRAAPYQLLLGKAL